MSTFGLFFCAMVLLAATIDVPEKVKAAFMEKFPEAEEVEWALENQTYKASCYNDGYYNEVSYTADGHWIQTMTYLDEMELPESLITYLEEKYSDYYLSEARLAENKEGKKYHIELTNEEDEVKKILFNEKGEIIK